MSLDTELDIWREQWQSETVVPPDLQRRVERQTRTMKLILIADIFVTIGVGGVFTAWAVRTPEPDIVVLAVVTWIFLASAWWFSMRINRGKWSPSALDTRAFLDLSISRYGLFVFFGFLLWYRRRKRAELVYLLKMRDDTEDTR
jgi:hypothetical protein